MGRSGNGNEQRTAKGDVAVIRDILDDFVKFMKIVLKMAAILYFVLFVFVI